MQYDRSRDIIKCLSFHLLLGFFNLSMGFDHFVQYWQILCCAWTCLSHPDTYFTVKCIDWLFFCIRINFNGIVLRWTICRFFKKWFSDYFDIWNRTFFRSFLQLQIFVVISLRLEFPVFWNPICTVYESTFRNPYFVHWGFFYIWRDLFFLPFTYRLLLA